MIAPTTSHCSVEVVLIFGRRTLTRTDELVLKLSKLEEARTSQQKSKKAMQELKDMMKSWKVEESRDAETMYHNLEALMKKYIN